MATVLDAVLERGTTALLPYSVTLSGTADNLSAALDIRWLAKRNPRDADADAVITKTLLGGQISLDSATHSIVTVQLDAADTAIGAAGLTNLSGTVVLYLGMRVYLAGAPEVVYGLFRDPSSGDPIVPTLTLVLGGVQAVS